MENFKIILEVIAIIIATIDLYKRNEKHPD